jgi:hypothetical protein
MKTTLNGKARQDRANTGNGRPPLGPFGDGGPRPAAEAPKPAEPATPAGDGRDSNGRFAKGWKGGPGNPFARKVAQLRSALINAVTEADIAEVAQALLKRAKFGWPAEAKLLLMYVVGKPTEAPNPDGMDLDEFRLLDAFPTRAELLRAMLDGLPPDQAVALFTQTLPKDRAETVSKVFRGKLMGDQEPDGDPDDLDDQDEGLSYGMASQIQEERQRHRQRR